MRRDIDLIRLLLLQIEGEQQPGLNRYSVDQQLYHKALLVEAGLIHGFVTTSEANEILAVDTTRLTWEGHEFIDAARAETIWNKAKEKIKKIGTSVTLPLLKELLLHVIKQELALGGDPME